MRGAMSERGDPRPLFGRGGDSPFASARVEKGAKRLIVRVGGEAAQRLLREEEQEQGILTSGDTRHSVLILCLSFIRGLGALEKGASPRWCNAVKRQQESSQNA
ncbi:hypothetical protein DUI87_20396 [Hirundo rustica rustica]|uniref:Uncharacterized protein n=1 Tax=Hirundo rustica rustica TaxID=333673 RepID=A0A3M0JQA2_HIRRU|nr:hypothetical protein DUI87_20396 [Hirundo rustica rustica]